ncbi:transcriptional regulator [Companilactobacillus mindensis DSM 14500]|uniref:Transcriptional regulator n=1 Tax=Companilactobacillus mindensis DSM 14500 TaxID=1423770 RepID=A0A0R1QH24_9LACO|nr:MurR/RpiR family transcriptional regulator [Companilactobacillus mindensis]KRL43806.1 transcriptional regulator [Companilactobacillus mindensis DSM 14500]GEO79745.1 RpiR family transcriptional regulator [Companilactobacillus mindensis]
MTIISQLSAAKNFNGSEKQLAAYIIKHKETVIDQSIQDLATATFSSTSTIVRLCRKIGLKGYKDFKIKLSAELQRHYQDISTVDPDFPFTEDDSNKEISQKLFRVMDTSLKQTNDLLTNELLERAVREILQAKKLGIFAYGDTYISALSFQNKLMKIDHEINLPTLTDESKFLAANFKPADCAILISYSGRSKSTYQIAKILRLNGCRIITITSDSQSEIAKLSDVILPIASSESEALKISPFASQVAIEYVLNTLYACLFVANYDVNQRHRLASEKLFSDSRFSDK